ncbi:MAG: hypothetical protein P8184_05590 [Calditrichia bacterium]
MKQISGSGFWSGYQAYLRLVIGHMNKEPFIFTDGARFAQKVLANI